MEKQDSNDSNRSSIKRRPQFSRISTTLVSEDEVEDNLDETSSTKNNSKDTPTSPPTSSRKPSYVWSHATKLNAKQAQCNICQKIISTSGGSVITFKARLETHEIKGPCSTQSTLKKSAIPLVQKRILDAIAIQCIIEDGRSFSDLRKAGMMKLPDALYCRLYRSASEHNSA
ncbi:unnamed protein product [Didymodactylos carnosus]|uniref:BED-type domain-containing protein n=1 Tax=Didymodactylos carnosus TaxID=1234261 RepID=A0A814H5E4_9BILA|nr:unnamed protein product [Didymodactylos carnosus]CAF3776098.1 unnamed protein product [Didymodactylos carnosus]